jgi:hypothetical protein
MGFIKLKKPSCQKTLTQKAKGTKVGVPVYLCLSGLPQTNNNNMGSFRAN